jgi:hypothetical protein
MVGKGNGPVYAGKVADHAEAELPCVICPSRLLRSAAANANHVCHADEDVDEDYT